MKFSRSVVVYLSKKKKGKRRRDNYTQLHEDSWGNGWGLYADTIQVTLYNVRVGCIDLRSNTSNKKGGESRWQNIYQGL